MNTTLKNVKVHFIFTIKLKNFKEMLIFVSMNNVHCHCIVMLL